MDKRVVITGMGVISPVGNDVNTFWKNLCEGYCGIDYITEYPTDELPVRIAGRIRDFQPEEYGMDKPFVRKQDLFTQYGVAAAYQAVHQSGLVSPSSPVSERAINLPCSFPRRSRYSSVGTSLERKSSQAASMPPS